MTSTTIKVPTGLRDRLAVIARAEHTTLAHVIERSLDAAEDTRFWTEVAATMSPDARSSRERFAATLTDGLDPAEDWSDIW